MVYMCADNSMHEQSYVDIAEMMQAGSTDKIKIIVQVDNIASSSEPGCRRYLINQNNRELITNLGEIDMANPQTLIDFVQFSRSRFSAKNYLLVLWDHGNGWPVGSYCAYKDKAIIYDQSSNNWIGVADGELKYAISEIKNILGKKIPILAFDACLMAMAEVADEIRDGTEIMFASEHITPWDGLPYHDILSFLTNNPSISPRNFAIEMVNLATASYNNGSQGYQPCTFSAVDLSKFTQARSQFAQTCKILSKYANTQSMHNARLETQTFSIEHDPPTPFDDYIDLLDFLSKSLSALTDHNDKTKIEHAIQTFESAVIKHANVGSYLDNSKGISVWFPDNYLALKNQLSEYRNLTWAQNRTWLSFLNNYFGQDDLKPSPVNLTSSAIGNKNDFWLSWTSSFDLAPVKYDIKEARAISEIFSDDCADFNNWHSDGFSIDTQYYHSIPSSFYSGRGNSINHELDLTTSLTLSSGGLLSFWTYYDTEESYSQTNGFKRDVFYVEISENSIQYYAIDSFYGTSQTWQEHRYLLPTGNNISLRFRYTTDATITRPGVYLDDIKIYSFTNIRDVYHQYPDTSFYFFNLAQDTYYYLITPVDSFGNVGFTSQAKTVYLEHFAEPYSLPSPFYTDCRIICDYPSVGPPEYFLKLFIYTLNGELVKQFDDTHFNQNTVYWDGRNQAGQEVASGLYIVVLKVGNFTRIGKIAKIR